MTFISHICSDWKCARWRCCTHIELWRHNATLERRHLRRTQASCAWHSGWTVSQQWRFVATDAYASRHESSNATRQLERCVRARCRNWRAISNRVVDVVDKDRQCHCKAQWYICQRWEVVLNIMCWILILIHTKLLIATKVFHLYWHLTAHCSLTMFGHRAMNKVNGGAGSKQSICVCFING